MGNNRKLMDNNRKLMDNSRKLMDNSKIFTIALVQIMLLLLHRKVITTSKRYFYLNKLDNTVAYPVAGDIVISHENDNRGYVLSQQNKRILIIIVMICLMVFFYLLFRG